MQIALKSDEIILVEYLLNGKKKFVFDEESSFYERHSSFKGSEVGSVRKDHYVSMDLKD